jgi:hypothetical protein
MRRLTLVILPAVLTAAALAAAACSPSRPAPGAGPASRPATAPTSPTAGTAQPPPPSALDLISKAVKDGRLDSDTALLYRIYAAFADPALPAEYASGEAGEDDAAVELLTQHHAELPADIRARAEPYLLRPSDSGSPFYSDGQPAAGAAQRTVAAATACTGGWTSAASASHPFKVWARCNASADSDVNRAVQMLDPIWAREVEVMGNPLPDRGGPDAGGDPSIDVYLVTPKGKVARAGDSTLGTNYGVAISAPPGPGGGPPNARSAFLLVGRAFLTSSPSRMRATLAHELFHALQFAFTSNTGYIDGGVDPAGHRNWLSWWFWEASATWAEHFADRDGGDHSYRQSQYSNAFQITPSVPLSAASPSAHRYGAWAWPLFMQQETGGEDVMYHAWRALTGATTPEAAQKALDSVFPFQKHFEDFALRNLNLDLPPGKAIDPRFQAIDSQFPNTVPPAFTATLHPQAKSDAAQKVQTEPIQELSTRYYHLFADPGVKQLTLTVKSDDMGRLNIDFIVKVKDKGWQRRPLESTLTLCRNLAADDVSELYVVVADHALDYHIGIVSLEATPLREPCTGVRGSLTYTRTSDRTTDEGRLDHRSETISALVVLKPKGSGWTDDGGSWILRGGGDSSGTCNGDGSFAYHVDYSGAGPFNGGTGGEGGTIGFTTTGNDAHVVLGVFGQVTERHTGCFADTSTQVLPFLTSLATGHTSDQHDPKTFDMTWSNSYTGVTGSRITETLSGTLLELGR